MIGRCAAYRRRWCLTLFNYVKSHLAATTQHSNTYKFTLCERGLDRNAKPFIGDPSEGRIMFPSWINRDECGQCKSNRTLKTGEGTPARELEPPMLTWPLSLLLARYWLMIRPVLTPAHPQRRACCVAAWLPISQIIDLIPCEMLSPPNDSSQR